MSLTICNANSDRPSVYLYGVIGDEFGGTTSDQFRRDLTNIPSKKPIDLHIDSPGGDFFQGVAMHSLLTQREGRVDVTVDGLAASAGSLVAMAGRTITMSKFSSMMIHEAQANYTPNGRATDHRKLADLLEAVNNTIVGIYSERWKGSEDDLRAALDAETWLFADDAVTNGLADGVSEALAIAAKADSLKVFNYKHVPDEVLNPKTPRRDAALNALKLFGVPIDE
jgi:ATP-dependent Clp protease, protease subunit